MHMMRNFLGLILKNVDENLDGVLVYEGNIDELVSDSRDEANENYEGCLLVNLRRRMQLQK